MAEDALAQVMEQRCIGCGLCKVRVAAVQAAPVLLDKEKTIEKACRD